MFQIKNISINLITNYKLKTWIKKQELHKTPNSRKQSESCNCTPTLKSDYYLKLRTIHVSIALMIMMMINSFTHEMHVNALQAAATHSHSCVPVLYHARSRETCWQPPHWNHLHSQWHWRQSFQCYIFAIPCRGLYVHMLIRLICQQCWNIPDILFSVSAAVSKVMAMSVAVCNWPHLLGAVWSNYTEIFCYAVILFRCYFEWHQKLTKMQAWTLMNDKKPEWTLLARQWWTWLMQCFK